MNENVNKSCSIIKQTIYFSLRVENKIYFTFLEKTNYVYKVGTQTIAHIVLPGEARFHTFKGHLIMASEGKHENLLRAINRLKVMLLISLYNYLF